MKPFVAPKGTYNNFALMGLLLLSRLFDTRCSLCFYDFGQLFSFDMFTDKTKKEQDSKWIKVDAPVELQECENDRMVGQD